MSGAQPRSAPSICLAKCRAITLSTADRRHDGTEHSLSGINFSKLSLDFEDPPHPLCMHCICSRSWPSRRFQGLMPTLSNCFPWSALLSTSQSATHHVSQVQAVKGRSQTSQSWCFLGSVYSSQWAGLRRFSDSREAVGSCRVLTSERMWLDDLVNPHPAPTYPPHTHVPLYIQRKKHIHAYIHTHTHRHTCIYINISRHTHTHEDTCMLTHILINSHIYTSTHVSS